MIEVRIEEQMAVGYIKDQALFAGIIEPQLQAKLSEQQTCSRISEPEVSCMITEQVSDDLFYSVYDSEGILRNLSMIDKNGNRVYLTGKRR